MATKKAEPKKADAKKVDAKKVDAKKVDAKKVDSKKAPRAGKAELVKHVASSVGITQAQAGSSIDSIVAGLLEHAKKGSVNVPGLGTFSVVKTAARTGVNPSTSKKIEIPAGKKLKFSASSTLKGNL